MTNDLLIKQLSDLDVRIRTLDNTLFMGLKCMTVLMEDVELATRDDVESHERMIARDRVREMVAMMKEMFAR